MLTGQCPNLPSETLARLGRSKSSSSGATVPVVIAVVACVLLAVAILLVIKYRRKQKHTEKAVMAVTEVLPGTAFENPMYTSSAVVRCCSSHYCRLHSHQNDEIPSYNDHVYEDAEAGLYADVKKVEGSLHINPSYDVSTTHTSQVPNL